MIGFKKKKILRNLVILEKCLDVNVEFQMLTIRKKVFSEKMLEILMENETPSLEYCIKLTSCGPNAQFIDALIETKRKDIVIQLLTNT
jgi:hypothetical protein